MGALRVDRTGEHTFVGHNERGAEVAIGVAGAAGSFTPGELLQIATAGCGAVTAEHLVTRRIGEDAAFSVRAGADRREGAHEYDALHVEFELDLAGLDDRARAALESAVRTALDRLCTVSRTIEAGTQVKVSFD